MDLSEHEVSRIRMECLVLAQRNTSGGVPAPGLVNDARLFADFVLENTQTPTEAKPA